MDLIYEGITTKPGLMAGAVSKRQNGPDLRRDYDLRVSPKPKLILHVRMDLIYEGITTKTRKATHLLVLVRMDLIYEGITTLGIFYFNFSTIPVRMDLIYEGITTTRYLGHDNNRAWSEWT